MTKKELETLHLIHPRHARYIRLPDDLPPVQALEKHRQLFTENEKTQLEQLGDQTYAPGKWTVLDTLQHLVDIERILSYRALCLARNEQAHLPGFDEAAYSNYTTAGQRTIADLLEEFDLLRQATITLYRHFTDEMLRRTGICAEIPVSVLALAYIIAGHPVSHAQLLRTAYFPLLDTGAIKVVINHPGYLPYFESLNKAWIEKDFVLEPDDRYVLEHAQEAILDRGGAMLYAVIDGQVAGTVALQPGPDGEVEMIKMAVDEARRGLGIGRLLILSAIAQAKKMGIRRLVLHSNSLLNAAAVSLYRRLGFTEVPLGESRYQRANIKMEINIMT
jgi:ribosomal protein S18 acetylase RimI-like enzyme